MRFLLSTFRVLAFNRWTLWVGLRYLRSQKSSRFLSFITYLSVAGVAFGVAVVIVVLSVMEGFESNFKKRLMTSDLHLQIEPYEDNDQREENGIDPAVFERSPMWSVLQSDARVERVSTVLATEVVMRIGRRVNGVMLKGVDPTTFDWVQSQVVERADPTLLYERVGNERVRRPGVYIGQELSYAMGIVPGDRVTLISPKEIVAPLASLPRLKRFVVEGVYSTGLPDQELGSIYVQIPQAESFLRRRHFVTHWEVTLKDFESARSVRDELRPLDAGFRVQDWGDLNASLFASLRLERVAMAVGLIAVIIVASFNIVTTLTLMVMEKKKEIAILKTMGAQSSEVAAIFFAEGLWIAFFGIVMGLLLALGASEVLQSTTLFELPDIYYDRSLPVVFDSMTYLGTSLLTLFVVLVACMYPGYRAAKLAPLEGMRWS